MVSFLCFCVFFFFFLQERQLPLRLVRVQLSVPCSVQHPLLSEACLHHLSGKLITSLAVMTLSFVYTSVTICLKMCRIRKLSFPGDVELLKGSPCLLWNKFSLQFFIRSFLSIVAAYLSFWTRQYCALLTMVAFHRVSNYCLAGSLITMVPSTKCGTHSALKSVTSFMVNCQAFPICWSS